MAKGSHPPTFKAYGVERRCYGCGRPLTTQDAMQFVGFPRLGVFGQECFSIAARWGQKEAS